MLYLDIICAECGTTAQKEIRGKRAFKYCGKICRNRVSSRKQAAKRRARSSATYTVIFDPSEFGFSAGSRFSKVNFEETLRMGFFDGVAFSCESGSFTVQGAGYELR